MHYVWWNIHMVICAFQKTLWLCCKFLMDSWILLSHIFVGAPRAPGNLTIETWPWKIWVSGVDRCQTTKHITICETWAYFMGSTVYHITVAAVGRAFAIARPTAVTVIYFTYDVSLSKTSLQCALFSHTFRGASRTPDNLTIETWRTVLML